ncbi:MAG: bifunctional 3,4-dihydroxy-2-butanone 4-phosphate synthase/GTP cyclohydrolase II [Elusimicrobia bacterium RIFCSPLOWO2_02_FULL_39_32]|nr:MAG: bifunctional 3,4-dihydroxy-2-butanone 4-phosphate synthase/GTP cyclohydrolase II [Elusimicrobia bacterium GWA2_38_7]OGR79448.1 MAG: bifunctional 3,4-dihydroxy-2-butanone 4-phosphate synthase/GTP cyclohydrolase II [Elusimicrobia bacterium RIFCSPHIGHO2_02_FULL_39_36]OGR92775.1 MAG: bifunctional 3,4-dihydroxy-2-butanone 4-phosphate synthase/GTP cyclohydrolase II [Elusimicrobia bacterium RIFCSPLOWO2_02_FULL_39_32]OGR99560.1 MAG: bifunctional 3,4-dihydroxy-2-butanone 4-phosphate synthase/GTP 
MILTPIPKAIEEIQNGKMVIIVDDPGRENEGDLYIPAQKVTPQNINFMATHGRGLICVAIVGERLDTLNIHPMVERPDKTKEAAFTVSVDAKKEVTTGISAHDRATTIKTLINPKTKGEDLARPGHVFPLRYQEGGVLVRAGHTEAAVDCAKLAGLYPAGVICEIMNDNGTMARMPELIHFSKKHKLKIISIQDLIEYRRKTEKLVRRVVSTELPTKSGKFLLHLYEDAVLHEYHVALVKGEPRGKKNVLVRVHSSCFTGDVLHSLRCDCGEQLEAALKKIEKIGQGVVLYMHQEGRGIGLKNKLHSYALQDKGLDTVEANKELGFAPDLREYGIGAQILVDLGLSTIRLMTNNPRKIVGLEGYHLKVTARVPLEIKSNPSNIHYLRTKKEKLGHYLKVL